MSESVRIHSLTGAVKNVEEVCRNRQDERIQAELSRVLKNVADSDGQLEQAGRSLSDLGENLGDFIDLSDEGSRTVIAFVRKLIEEARIPEEYAPSTRDAQLLVEFSRGCEYARVLNEDDEPPAWEILTPEASDEEVLSWLDGLDGCVSSRNRLIAEYVDFIAAVFRSLQEKGAWDKRVQLEYGERLLEIASTFEARKHELEERKRLERERLEREERERIEAERRRQEDEERRQREAEERVRLEEERRVREAEDAERRAKEEAERAADEERRAEERRKRQEASARRKEERRQREEEERVRLEEERRVREAEDAERREKEESERVADEERRAEELTKKREASARRKEERRGTKAHRPDSVRNEQGRAVQRKADLVSRTPAASELHLSDSNQRTGRMSAGANGVQGARTTSPRTRTPVTLASASSGARASGVESTSNTESTSCGCGCSLIVVLVAIGLLIWFCHGFRWSIWSIVSAFVAFALLILLMLYVWGASGKKSEEVTNDEDDDADEAGEEDD